MIIRRTEGWPARNKQYVFFLFNDILLWTTKKGTFQNVVALESCEVLPWKDRNNIELKFKIVARSSAGIKTLYLECKTRRQKNDWLSAIEAAITNSQKSESQMINDIPSTIFEDSEDEIAEDAPTKSTQNVSELKVVIKKYIDNTAETTPTTNAKIDYDNPNEQKQQTQNDEDPTYDYERSQNYSVHDFQGFDPFDDNTSQISESDLGFFEDNGIYRKIRDGSSIDMMSPFTKHTRRGNTQNFPEEQKVESISPKFTETKANDLIVSRSITEKVETDSATKSSNYGIIRRSSVDEIKTSVASPVGFASMTISLSDLTAI